ncbi:EGF-like repeat and discoidin I-like domain-containing protein 3, partial [Acropora muricata]|uniref:EGF-like repeat and discoidin I-like domain-containing protein 3 n=1 Tax=Acropora muricata TaxID=159855 RepID=UPI0034E5F08F
RNLDLLWNTASFFCKECQDALGMENGGVLHEQITASSEMNEYGAACQGRLNVHESVQGSIIKSGAWVAGTSDQSQYKLQYSNDGRDFEYYHEQGKSTAKEFTGNTDENSIVSHDLIPPIRARYIRFRPALGHQHISMRVELYGCCDMLS